jgi:autotransporter-associated beta strand protein
LNLNTTFTGVISDAARVTAFAKVGAGTLTLNDVDLVHKGTMAVSGGVLALAGGTVNSRISTNVLITAPGVLDVSVATDPNLRLGTGTVVQALRGNGTIRGSVVLGANARLEPGGPNATGLLTVTNAVTLAGVTTLELNRTNTPNCDGLAAASITGGGSLFVTNIGPGNFAPGDTFQLFSKPVSGITLSGSLPALPCANLQWTNKLAVDGSLAVIGTSCVNITPTNITAVMVGGALEISWPADQIGWTLLSNWVDVVNATQWYPVPGSTTTNRVIIPPEPSKANVFFRLRYTPCCGSGRGVTDRGSPPSSGPARIRGGAIGSGRHAGGCLRQRPGNRTAPFVRAAAGAAA